MKSILVVDDSVSMRQMVSHTLKESGFTVAEAKDGQDALNIAKSKSFDLVISDVNMPIMDGIELIKQLRSLSQYKFTPLLMLTTESSSGKKSEGKAAGATGWLVGWLNPLTQTNSLPPLIRF